MQSKNFIKNLLGKTITDISRKSKLIIIHISDGNFLTCHLKMTGQLRVITSSKNSTKISGGGSSLSKQKKLEHPHKHTRVSFYFNDGSECHFNDTRRFGYIKIETRENLEILKRKKYGIEPFTENFTEENFYTIFNNRKTSIKALLLNQKVIAGLGNIYVDEACFSAKIHPETPVPKLKNPHKKLLFKNIPKILQKAIDKGGTSFYTFTDSQHKKGNFLHDLMVFQRHGQHCRVCKSTIEKILVAGRGTHFCPKCQPNI